MDFKTQLAGLNELLKVIFDSEVGLDSLMRDLGFEPDQIKLLNGKALESLTAQFLEVIHKRLTSESGQDSYYHILNRRYGLDGDPPDTLEVIAQQNGWTSMHMQQLFEEILQRCRSKTAQEDFKKGLKHIIVRQLRSLNELPSREQVAEKLKRLTNLHAAADLTRLDYEAKRKELFKQIQAELDALDSEYTPLLKAAEANIASLENEIRTDVLLHGESVQAGAYRAVFTRGRVSWDNLGIEKYASSHPELLKFRKQGEPSVALRLVGE